MIHKYFKCLQLNPDATKNEIKAAYRKLAKKYHPDINKKPNASSNFNKIKRAYDYLIDNYSQIEYEREKARQNTTQQTSKTKEKSRTRVDSSQYQYARKQTYSPPTPTPTPTAEKKSNAGESIGGLLFYIILCLWLIKKLSECS